jgi:NADH:ubiquinone oxidoreductase subunit K
MIEIGIVLIILSIISIVYNRKNYILVLVSLELFLLGTSLIFVSSSIIFDDMNGIMTALFLLTIGAAESAIGLSILTKTYSKSTPKI